MSRPAKVPNFATSQWHTKNQPHDTWLDGALCAQNPYLPWTAEHHPGFHALDRMRQLCEQCPARRQCAAHALTISHGGGGMYAGIWIPWVKAGRVNRKPIRQQLRQIAQTGQ